MPRAKTRTAELRAELLTRAVTLLEQDGPTALRARHVASAAGTSTAALYELFGNKTGLIRAIFYEGFCALADQLERVAATDDPRADVVDVLRGSRSFALENPMLFEVMYARPVGEFDPSSDDLDAAGRIYNLVIDRVRRWFDAARASTDPVDAAHALIALNRGLIAMELAGMLGRSRTSRERRWQLAVDAQLDGLEHG
jgi:AcrR family transcriptional regulator